MTQYRRADEVDAFGRAEIVEQEARAFHESDAHPDAFTTCKRGCWDAGEVAVDDAITAGELVPVPPP